MKPLIILLAVFAITAPGSLLLQGHVNYCFAGRAAMSAMLLFTALGHFMYMRGMALMMPAFLPFKHALVIVSGLAEIAAAAGLLIHSIVVLTGWLLIVFFILILPVNINAAMRHVDYQKATYNGPGLRYLWLRVPLQVLFIAWVYWFAIYCH